MSMLDDSRDLGVVFQISPLRSDRFVLKISKAALFKNSHISPEPGSLSYCLEKKCFGFFPPDEYWSNEDGWMGGRFVLNADRRHAASSLWDGVGAEQSFTAEMDSATLFGIREKGALSFNLTITWFCSDCTETHTHTHTSHNLSNKIHTLLVAVLFFSPRTNSDVEK